MINDKLTLIGTAFLMAMILIGSIVNLIKSDRRHKKWRDEFEKDLYKYKEEAV